MEVPLNAVVARRKLRSGLSCCSPTRTRRLRRSSWSFTSLHCGRSARGPARVALHAAKTSHKRLRREASCYRSKSSLRTSDRLFPQRLRRPRGHSSADSQPSPPARVSATACWEAAAAAAARRAAMTLSLSRPRSATRRAAVALQRKLPGQTAPGRDPSPAATSRCRPSGRRRATAGKLASRCQQTQRLGRRSALAAPSCPFPAGSASGRANSFSRTSVGAACP